jgi:hypothetical protein
MGTTKGSSGRQAPTRGRDSIPVLGVRLGPARDFLVALAVLAVTLIIAMVVAYLAFG